MLSVTYRSDMYGLLEPEILNKNFTNASSVSDCPLVVSNTTHRMRRYLFKIDA